MDQNRHQRHRRDRHDDNKDIGLAFLVRARRDRKQRHAPMAQHVAGHHHGRHGLTRPHLFHNRVGNHLGTAQHVHQLAENRTRQEQRKKADHLAAQRLHEDLPIGRHDRRPTRQDRGQHRATRGQDQDRNPAIGQIHQTDEKQDNAEHGTSFSHNRDPDYPRDATQSL